MLLVEFDINASTNYLSQEGINLTHWWDNKIISFTPPIRKTSKIYGGYCGLEYGSISFSPDLFDGDWPPPISEEITVKYTATNEAAAETIFTGKAHLKSITKKEVKYDIFDQAFTAEVAKSTAYADTLVNVMTTLCGAGILNLTINTTNARGASPAVSYTTPNDILAIKLADKMCAFFSHFFYIEGSTLYLCDMLSDNGTRTMTEFDFFSANYTYETPIATISDSDDTTTQTSAYNYGKEQSIKPFHPTGANIDTALTDILTIQHKPRTKIKIPFTGSIPAPGEQISWTDESLAVSTDMSIYARKFRYDFDNEEIIITGEGAISAT